MKSSDGGDELYNVDISPHHSARSHHEIENIPSRSPRKSIDEKSTPNLKLDLHSTSGNSQSQEIRNLAQSSPREVVQAAVNNFCDDTFAIVEERVKKQRKKSKEFSDSFKNSPRSAAETPREVVLNAVSSFCEDVIAVAEGEAIKVLSPRPLAGPSEKKEKALPQANPSPRRTKKSESQSDKPKKGEKRAADSSPKQSNAQPTPSQSDSEFSSDAVLKGQKVSRIPPPKKVKPKVTAPSRAEMESDVPHPTDPLNGNPQTDSSKNNKDIGKRPVKDKKKSGKPKGLSPSPSAGDGLFPPINRPSPPSGERNQNQNENPRRKMSRYSSKEDKKENANTHLPDVTPSHQRNPRDKPSKSVPNNRILDTNEDGLLINREQSKSAQISDDRTTLPPIKGLPRSETTPRHKKRRKPLFLRLEDKARKLQMEIEREKMEMYHKIKMKKIQSQPTKEEIEQHMLHYQQHKLQQQEHERELAEARKRDWKAHHPKYSKYLSPQKLDFIEEQKAREREEEEARKARLEKAKEFNSAIKVGGAISASSSPEKKHFSPNHQMEVVGMSPRRHSKDDLEPVPELDLKIIVHDPSRQQSHTPPHSTKQKMQQTPHKDSPHQLSKVADSAIQHQKLSPHPKGKKQNPKKIISQSSSAVENLGSPYDGKTGPDWVAEVMEMDEEETILADVYETGFSMLMVEKGILSRDLEEEHRELSPS